MVENCEKCSLSLVDLWVARFVQLTVHTSPFCSFFGRLSNVEGGGPRQQETPLKWNHASQEKWKLWFQPFFFFSFCESCISAFSSGFSLFFFFVATLTDGEGPTSRRRGKEKGRFWRHKNGWKHPQASFKKYGLVWLQRGSEQHRHVLYNCQTLDLFLVSMKHSLLPFYPGDWAFASPAVWGDAALSPGCCWLFCVGLLCLGHVMFSALLHQTKENKQILGIWKVVFSFHARSQS